MEENLSLVIWSPSKAKLSLHTMEFFYCKLTLCYVKVKGQDKIKQNGASPRDSACGSSYFVS